MTEAERPTGARVTYIASLTTNDENLKADLISFRQLLSGIELSFPPPSAEVATTLGTLDDEGALPRWEVAGDAGRRITVAERALKNWRMIRVRPKCSFEHRPKGDLSNHSFESDLRIRR